MMFFFINKSLYSLDKKSRRNRTETNKSFKSAQKGTNCIDSIFSSSLGPSPKDSKSCSFKK